MANALVIYKKQILGIKYKLIEFLKIECKRGYRLATKNGLFSKVIKTIA